jgi:hypothetical protein
MQLIRQHADAGAGAEIVGSIGFERNVAEMIRQHHERLDGSGYPAGLRDEEILPEARILAVADVVEAMISHRPYRPALPIEVAMAELEDGAGTRYDAAARETAIFFIREQGFTFSKSLPAFAGPRWGRPSDTRAGFSSSETEPASAARLSLPSVQLLSGGSTTAMISTCSVIGNRSNAFSERSTQPASRRTRRSRANEAGSHAT